MKKTRRLLLATAALSTAAAVEAACSKDPLPGNPKGSHYEDSGPVAVPANPKGSHYDQGMDASAAKPDEPQPTATEDAGTKDAATKDAGKDAATKTAPTTNPTVRPHPPGNPKGSHYDNGLEPKPKK